MKKQFISAAAAFLVLTFGVCVPAYSQIFPRTRTVSSDASLLLSPALKDVVVKLRVEYQLENPGSHEKFNIESKDYFGYKEGLGIKIKDGWILPDSLLTPWKNDESVKQFPELKPIISGVSSMNESDSTWAKSFIPTWEDATVVSGTSYYIVKDTLNPHPGLLTSESEKLSDGWMVIISKKDESYSQEIYRHRRTSDDPDKETIKLEDIDNPESVVLGIYLAPTFPAPGEFRLEIAGVSEIVNGSFEIKRLTGTAKEVSPKVEKPVLVPAQQDDTKVQDTSEEKAKDKEARKGRKNQR